MITFPRKLRKGDKIAIVSPAGIPVKSEVLAAADILRAEGWKVEISPNALGQSGSYSGTDEQRYSDLANALTDPEVRAIICSRGGYGAVHILDRLSKLPLRDDPKWIVGFSDISALHALMVTNGIASIHASMAKHIMLGPDDEDNAALFKILRGERPAFTFPRTPNDHPGLADGQLMGGNLAVIAELINTPFDIIKPDTILFIEEVSEPIYKVERIMYQLQLSGVLQRLKGIIFGQFTEYKSDRNHTYMEDMLREMTVSCDCPIAYNAPIGHVFHNIPVIEGAHVTLKVTANAENHLIYWQ